MFMNYIKLNMKLWIILDFEDLLTQNTSDPVKGLTISTDESTKVIKVLSVNGARQTSLLTTLNAKQQVGLICYNLLQSEAVIMVYYSNKVYIFFPNYMIVQLLVSKVTCPMRLLSYWLIIKNAWESSRIFLQILMALGL